MNPVSVTDLNKYIKNIIAGDENLEAVLVKGEISNFKHHYTGHMYFTLKDENSLIKCIMFKTYTASLNFVPKDGMKVILFGSVSIFERDGVYQIYCKSMQEDGIGDLYKAYEELKKKLELEGLFETSHKKKIPFMPKIIGVLTSNTGAVIRDIINVSTRRNPNVYIRLFPIPVQGSGAGEKIANGIKFMNKNKLADVLILARGGGSLEDLWPFNEEVVARAIYESDIPIISAVGHETDFTISDFVSDLRAPTPSAAAELAVTDISDLIDSLNKVIYLKPNHVSLYSLILEENTVLEREVKSRVYKNPYQKINDLSIVLDGYLKQLENSMIKKIKDDRLKSTKLIAKLDTLSPLKTLTRGYSITEYNGKIISSKKELKKDMNIVLKFYDGNVDAKIL